MEREKNNPTDAGEEEKLPEEKNTEDPVNEFFKQEVDKLRQKLFTGDYSSVIFNIDYRLSETHGVDYDPNKVPLLSAFLRTPEAKAEFQKKEFIDFLVNQANVIVSRQHAEHKVLLKCLNLFDLLDVSDSIFRRSEMGEIGQKALLNCVDTSHDVIKDATRIINTFKIPQSFVESEEVKKQVIDKKINFSCGDTQSHDRDKMKYLGEVKELQSFFKIPDEALAEKVKKSVLNAIRSSYNFDKEYFSRLKQFFNINISDESIQDGVKQIVLERLKERGFLLIGIKEIIENTSNPLSIIQSEAISQSVKTKMIECLGYGNGEIFGQYKEIFKISESDIDSQEFRDAWMKGMVRNLERVFEPSGYNQEPYFIKTCESIIKLKKCVPFGDELMESPEVQNIVKDNFLKHEKNIGSKRLIMIGNFLPESVKLSQEIQAAVRNAINYALSKDDFVATNNLIHTFGLSEEIANKIYVPKIVQFFQERKKSLLEIVEVVERLRPADSFYISQELRIAISKDITQRISSGKFDDIILFQEKFKVGLEEIQYLAKEEAVKKILNGSVGDFLKITERFKIDIQQPEFKDVFTAATLFCKIKIDDPVIYELISDEVTELDLKRLFALVREKSTLWQDGQAIVGPFQSGAEAFGYKRMLEYMHRDGLSLHDAVHAFRDIVELFRASGLSETEFYGQVLQQVRMDDRKYSDGTAHHHLNTIALTANKNVAEVIARAHEYKEIERLQELANVFSSPQAVFASWFNLKKYSELQQLLGKTELMDELKKLRREGKEALYKYIEMLAFHPDSKVNMNAVMQFWRTPELFLAAAASHTPDEVHDRKKPSNYIHMPNLDLAASELRDALVEGKMDGLSAFTPLEIHYTIPVEEIKQESLPDLVSIALGSNKKGIEGLARNSKKLFSELGKLFKPYGLSVVSYLQDKILPEEVDLSHQIDALLYDRNFGMERPPVKTREFVARISRKSDPEGAIAGDDTVNCMPFGDGKNTVYTFNPNTAQFVVRLVKGDGKERTIAQSVLTKDMDVKVPIPDLVAKLQQEGEHLENMLPADVLSASPVYVACDNIEVAPNYSDEKYKKIIETIFRDFFREYMSRYATKEGLDTKRIPIGQGYTDAFSQLPTELNTFAPQAPVSYSDKTGPNVYMLDLTDEKGQDMILQRKVKELEVSKRAEVDLPKIKGLDYLTFEDTLKVGYIEGKAYSDNQSLMQFLFNVENGLIAKDINNSAKDRPNMSLKYSDGNGQMKGYLLSWEGKLNDESVEHIAEEFFGKPCVYIIDIASDKENRMAGGRLIQGFTELYKKNYLDKGNIVPIFAQAREATSYQIVKRQLDKLGKGAGFNFELVELPTYEVGKDVMHPIIIRPVSTKT